MRIAVLASGNGTNLQNLIDKEKELGIKIVCMISNNDEAFALERAKKHKIPTFFIGHKGKTREAHEIEIVNVLEKYKIQLVVLAGYMRLLSGYIINKYKYKILNIHPALLPSFPGVRGYEDAWEYGVKVSGCTVHFVDEGCDTGPIIVQKVNPINDDDTFKSFKERGLKLEYEAYAEAVKIIAS